MALQHKGVYRHLLLFLFLSRSIREGAPDAKEEAVMLLEAWRDFEAAGSEFRWVVGGGGLG
jgi:hypothetical protein